MFKDGIIQGVIARDIKKNLDERGWLAECFRHDEMSAEHFPVMAYVSITLPGIVRGPHEHLDQTDYFCFVGPSNFKIVLWDNRRDSSTFNFRQVVFAGTDRPKVVVVPPRIVHAYKNIGQVEGQVLNFPNRLYGGEHRVHEVDEIRHESAGLSPFKFEE